VSDFVARPSQLPGGQGTLLALPLLVLLLSGAAHAQDRSAADSTRERPYQVGFSAAAFVKILEAADTPGRYQLYGRYRRTPHWTLRAALRYEQLFSGDDRVRLAARTGADYVFRESDRLQLYGGADLVAGYDRFANGTRTYRAGAAPVFGLLVYLTPYLSLSVEPRLVVAYTYADPTGGEAPAESVSVAIKGDGLLILSVHF